MSLIQLHLIINVPSFQLYRGYRAEIKHLKSVLAQAEFITHPICYSPKSAVSCSTCNNPLQKARKNTVTTTQGIQVLSLHPLVELQYNDKCGARTWQSVRGGLMNRNRKYSSMMHYCSSLSYLPVMSCYLSILSDHLAFLFQSVAFHQLLISSG